MSVNAQLAQGTKFYIAGTGGSAKNITAVAVGIITKITSAAHGLSNGDVVAIADITGTVGTDTDHGLNGNEYVVMYKTTDDFYVNEDTTGLSYTSGGTATPYAWIQVKEIRAINPTAAEKPDVECSDLDSTTVESKTGLGDEGTLSIDIHILESDSGQAACLAAYNADTNKSYKIVSAASITRTFSANCKAWPTIPTHTVGGIQVGTAIFKRTSAVTVS